VGRGEGEGWGNQREGVLKGRRKKIKRALCERGERKREGVVCETWWLKGGLEKGLRRERVGREGSGGEEEGGGRGGRRVEAGVERGGEEKEGGGKDEGGSVGRGRKRKRRCEGVRKGGGR